MHMKTQQTPHLNQSKQLIEILSNSILKPIDNQDIQEKNLEQ